MSGCCAKGPGFASPRDAFRYAQREKLVYIPCIVPAKDRPDYLATVDIDPDSPSYGKVQKMRWLPMPFNESIYYMKVGNCRRLLLFRSLVDFTVHIWVMRFTTLAGTPAPAVTMTLPSLGTA